jgi:hypothetical protein
MLSTGILVFSQSQLAAPARPAYVDYPSACTFEGTAQAIRLRGRGVASVAREFAFSAPAAESVELKGGHLVKALEGGSTARLTAASILVKSPEQLLPADADSRDYYVEYAFRPEGIVELKLMREAGEAQGELRGGVVTLDRRPLTPPVQELRIDWVGKTPLLVSSRLREGWKGPLPIAGPLQEVTHGVLEGIQGTLKCPQYFETVSGRLSWDPAFSCDLGAEGHPSRPIESITLDAQGFHLVTTGCMRVESPPDQLARQENP